jgi:putative hemolysin
MDRIDETLLQQTGRRAARRPRYRVGFACSDADRRAAQRLRWRVFAGELGARLDPREPGVDQDRFDPFCEHLIVREEDTGEVVGTYRVLSPEAARRIGRYYAESEFDLVRLQLLRGRLVEVGRSCIHPEHRGGALIALLWSGLARYMVENGYGYLGGCASMSMLDGGHAAASVFGHLRSEHLAPIEYRVFPRLALPLEELDATRAATPPALLRGYLRAGAWICGEPAWDPDFNTADFFVLLPLTRLSARYARHFLGGHALRV